MRSKTHRWPTQKPPIYSTRVAHNTSNLTPATKKVQVKHRRVGGAGAEAEAGLPRLAVRERALRLLLLHREQDYHGRSPRLMRRVRLQHRDDNDARLEELAAKRCPSWPTTIFPATERRVPSVRAARARRGAGKARLSQKRCAAAIVLLARASNEQSGGHQLAFSGQTDSRVARFQSEIVSLSGFLHKI